MKFEYIAQQSEGSGTGGAFLRMDTGDSVNAVIRGDVHKYWQIWPQGGTKQVFDEPTAGSQLRFKVNVVINEDGQFVAKIWDFPAATNNMLFEIQKEVDLEKTKIKLSRVGQGKKKSWMIIPLGPLDAKALKQVEAVELLSFAPRESQTDTGDLPGEF